MSPDSDPVARAVELLRRASVEVSTSDTRRFFIPRGLPVRFDLNLIGGALLAGLAASIEQRAAVVSRGRRVGRRGKS